MVNRPVGVTLFGILNGVAGFILLLMGAGLLVLPAMTLPYPMNDLVSLVTASTAVILVVVGVLSLVIAYALFSGKSGAYWLSLGVWCFDIVMLLSDEGLSWSLLLPVAGIAYFVRYSVQDFFKVKLGFGW